MFQNTRGIKHLNNVKNNKTQQVALEISCSDSLSSNLSGIFCVLGKKNIAVKH